jgi:hypothetical protein
MFLIPTNKVSDSIGSRTTLVSRGFAFPQVILTAIEQKQAKEQEKEQKEFELQIAEKMPTSPACGRRAKETPFTSVPRARPKLRKPLPKPSHPNTFATIRYKLYDSQTSKMVLLPDNLKLPILINPGEQRSAQLPSTEESAAK